MKNKGFTLIELLAVIVILGVIIAIAIPIIGDAIDKTRERSYQATEKTLEKLAAIYLSSNHDVMPVLGTPAIVTLSQLKSVGLIDGVQNLYDTSKECDAFVEVTTDASDSYRYDAYINCDENYLTAGYYGLAKSHVTVYGDGPSDYFRSVTANSSGKVVVGYSNSNSVDLAGLTYKGAEDAIIVKYDDSGNVLWKQNYGGTRRDYFYGVDAESSGYVTVGTSMSEEGDLIGINRGIYDAVIVKYDNNGSKVWNKNYGGSYTDYFWDVLSTNDGYVAVGYSDSVDNDLFSITKYGGVDAIIVKYDKDGNVVWNKNFGGTSTDVFYDIELVTDGYIAVGYSQSGNNGTLLSGTAKGGVDALIVKYDFNGNPLWFQRYGGTGTDVYNGVSEDLEGNLIASGQSNSSNIDLDGLSKGLYDGIYVKYDSNGNIVSKSNFGGTGDDYFYDNSFDGQSIIVSGYSSSNNGDLTALNKGGWDGIVVKYDMSSNIMYKKNFGGTSTDIFYDVYALDENYMVAGYSSSTNGDITGLNRGSDDGIVFEFNSNNTLLWNKNFGGGPSSDYFNGVATASDGYLSVGYSNSNGGHLLNMNQGNNDGILVKRDFDGTIMWKKNYGGNGNDYLTRVVRGLEEKYVAVGYSDSTTGDLSDVTRKGGVDGIIFTLDDDGAILWKKNYGGTDTDSFYAVETTNSGYIAVGYTSSTNGDLTGVTNYGGADAVIVNYDNQGNILWQNKFGGSSSDYFYGITIAKDGYLAIGYSNSTNGELTGLNKGNYDGIIVKYNFDGQLLWKKSFGGTAADYFRDITVLNDYYYVVGMVNSSDGDLASMAKGGTDAVIIQYDSNGERVWTKTYGGTGTDNFYAVKLYDNEILAVGGSTSGDGDLFSIVKYGNYDSTIVKYDLDGNIVANKNYGGTSDEQFYDVAVVRNGYIGVGYSVSIDQDFTDRGIGDVSASTVAFYDSVRPHFTMYGDGVDDYIKDGVAISGGYVTVGYSNSTNMDYLGLARKGAEDAIISKYDNSGNIIWSKNFGGSRSDFFTGVDVDTNGYIAVGYGMSVYDDIAGTNRGVNDAYIAKYNLNGELVWNKNYGGSNNDYFNQVKTTTDGYVVVGYTASVDYDLYDVTKKGGTDAIIVKYDKNGKILWKQNYGGTSTDGFNNLIVVSDGYIAVGYSASSNIDLLDVVRKGGTDGILVKYDFSGNILWKVNIGGTGTDYLTDITVDSDGNLAVSGFSTSSTGDLNGLNKGGYDGIISKLTSTGTLIWAKTYGGTADDLFYGIESISDGYVVGGNTLSSNGDLTGLTVYRYNEGSVVTYDFNGNLMHKKVYGGSGYDFITSLINLNTSYIALGYSNSTNYDLSGLNKAGYDGIAVQYNLTDGSINWKKNYGGSVAETYFYGVVPANEGYISVGYGNATGGDVIGLNKGGWDGLIVKRNNAGDVIWKQNYGGTATDHLYKVTNTSDNYYVAVGYSESSNGDFTDVVRKGGTDGTLIKFTEEGSILWKKNYGGTTTDVFYNIESTMDGFVAVGYSESSNGDLTGVSRYGGSDALIVKYDLDGNVIWAKNYGGTATDYFRGIVVLNDGYVAVGASNSTNGELTGLNNGLYDSIVVKYDLNGNVVWKKNFGGSADDYYWDTISINDQYYMVGYTSSSDKDLSGVAKGGTDAIVVCYESDGSLNWKKTYGGTSTDVFYGIISEEDEIIATGYSASSNVDLTDVERRGGTDAIVVNYYLDGKISKKQNFGGSSTDVFYDIARKDFTYFGVGYSYSINFDLVDVGIGYASAFTVGFQR